MNQSCEEDTRETSVTVRFFDGLSGHKNSGSGHMIFLFVCLLFLKHFFILSSLTYTSGLVLERYLTV